MTRKSSHLIEVVNLVYTVVKGSVLFWLALLSRGLVYGWVFAIKVILQYFASDNPQDIRFRDFIKQVEEVAYAKVISAMMTFFFSLGLTGWLLSLVNISQLSFAMFYIGGLAWLVWLVIVIYYVKTQSSSGENQFYQSLLEIKKDFQKVIFIFLLAFIFVWLTLTKTMLGWLLFPGIYFYLVGRIQKVQFKGVKS
ncbi:hypothetical protein [Streptococcus equinus]|uniref:DUF624 domain-containing protein n=1 Tax=Streptococcus equinus TaxID=1335 RepID=A0A1G9MBC1_STREI|nr:hypothetical protein [Streptococcus equinus]TFH44353.1 hypothetical protein E3305_07970 [Streptococcus equinus]SDL71566.1 hypothetical protein SAMN05216400_1452 [Streptococcus equinus]SFQ72364.1 hypothetical protein SAMN05216422_1429 [Streptococcus equinus]